MKRALALGPAVYAAPAILGSTTTVFAQVTAACAGQTCANFTNCLGNPNCFCFSLANGTGFCGTSISCSGLLACSVQNPCAAGFVCQVNTCCGAAGICVPTSTQCTPQAVGTPSAHGGGTTAGR